jgi:lysophospholipase L1-like esterase
MKRNNIHKPRLQAKIILAILGVLLAIFSTEIALRRFLPIPDPFDLGEIEEWKPFDDSQFTPKLNEYGFREDPLNGAIFDDDYTRILFLGDSFTYGQGVAEGQNRFSDIIESEINHLAENDSSLQYHIYNAARPGTNPDDWLGYYEKLRPIYKPDHVFAIFFLRDGTTLCTSFRCYEDVFNEIKGEFENRFLYRHSYIGKLIFNRAMRQQFSDFYSQQIISAYLGNSAETAQWQIQKEALLQIRDLSQEQGISFNLIIFPILYNLDTNYQFYGVEEEISRFANDENIPVFSLTPGFIGEEESDLWISANDQHPNERGHQIAADTLLPYVLDVILEK